MSFFKRKVNKQLTSGEYRINTKVVCRTICRANKKQLNQLLEECNNYDSLVATTTKSTCKISNANILSSVEEQKKLSRIAINANAARIALIDIELNKIRDNLDTLNGYSDI